MRVSLLRTLALVEIALKSAREDVLLAELWNEGATDALEVAARRYIDATMAGMPPESLDVWKLGWAGEEDLPPQPRDASAPLFSAAECDFLTIVACHVGKTLEVREIEEAVVALRASAQKTARAA